MRKVPTTLPPIWRGADPLVLASRSESRRALLSAAGLDAEFVAPEVDERALEDGYLARGGSVEGVALELAQAKALAASADRQDAYCIGADQTLTLEGRILHKSRDLPEAAQTLALLSGKTHRLTSASCVARAGRVLVVHRDHADVRMRALDPAEISRYLERAGPGVLASVGAYQGEGLGVHLFERIEGDHSVVLGLPMLSLLAWLRRENLISL
ncbi:MAG TPA: Maf family protein [Roseiarcus sp.]|jgi:septum formation protein|nr:Maf family protein [Roseiarcus sp.]